MLEGIGPSIEQPCICLHREAKDDVFQISKSIENGTIQLHT